MSSLKTNNSYLKEKILLRLQAVNEFDQEKYNVLDCFHGNGEIWTNIKKYIKYVKIKGLDIKEYDNISLLGDNLKSLPKINIDKYNIIDVDAYGSPCKQLKEILPRINKRTLIFYTFIQSGMGCLDNIMMYDLGYTKEMLNKVHSIFFKNGHEKFLHWLSVFGITSVKYICHNRKYYGFFYHEGTQCKS